MIPYQVLSKVPTKELNKDLLEGNIDQESLKRWYNYFGEKIFNVNGIEDMLKEYYDSYFDDLVYDDEIIDKLLEMEIISKTDEYFEVDEDGDVDTDVPKFDPEDYRSEFVDKSMENINDVVDHCISEFGFEDLENYVDIDKLAEEITDYDGIGKVISSYDGKEREQTVGDVTYYIYQDAWPARASQSAEQAGLRLLHGQPPACR